MFSSLSSDGIRRRGFFRRISILSRFPSLEGGNSNNGDTLDDSRIIALLSGRALLGDDNGDIARYRDFLHGSGLDAFLEHVNGTTVSSRGSGPASRSAIQAMPVFKFGEKQDLNKGKAQRHGDCDSDHNYQDQEHGDGDGDGDDDDMHCAVCKEAFEIDVQVRKMPCQHMYHSDCILPWLALHSTCPICRREMRSESESESESEPESESEIHHHDHHHHLASREIRAMTDIRGIPYPGGRIRNRRRASRRGRRSVDRIGVGVGVRNVVHFYWLPEVVVSMIGLKQGCPLSLTLYVLYVHEISNYVESFCDLGAPLAMISILLLQYAGDIVLISDSPEGLQRHLNTLKPFFTDKNL